MSVNIIPVETYDPISQPEPESFGRLAVSSCVEAWNGIYAESVNYADHNRQISSTIFAAIGAPLEACGIIDAILHSASVDRASSAVFILTGGLALAAAHKLRYR